MQTDCCFKMKFSVRLLPWLVALISFASILSAPQHVLAIAAVPPDVAETKRLADAGDTAAQSTLGAWYRWGAYGFQVNQKLAAEWYLRAAKQGYSPAEVAIGEMYEFGEGVARDHQQALQWIRKATVERPGSAIWIGQKHADHARTPQDRLTAMEWYRISAEAGNDTAQTALGILYESSGEFAQATRWFRRAARTSAPAMAEIGHLCATGKGVPQDYNQAVSWYHKAIAADGRSGRYELGLLYEQGFGVPQDRDKAMELYYAVAAINSDARSRLLTLYEANLDVPADPENAIAWYRKAAESGNARAQVGLGLHYEFGRGVRTNPDVASALYNLAAQSAEPGIPGLIGSWPLRPETQSLLKEMAKPGNLLKAIDYFVAHPPPHPAPLVVSD
jgi:TPR repeat protein